MQKKIIIKKTNSINTNKILVFDIETYSNKLNYHEPYLIVLYSDKETKVWFKENSYDNIIRKFIDYLFKYYSNYTVFAHNLKDFDGRFILDELYPKEFHSKQKTCLFRDQKIMSINLKKNITLKDSVLLLPDSLATLAKNFNLEIRKGELDHQSIRYSNYKNYKEEAIEYCILDCKILYDVLREFEKLSKPLSDVNPLTCITLPQFAYHTFLSKKFFPEDWEIYHMDKEKYKFVHSGYYGGRVDVFRTYIKFDTDSIVYLDVNSLYPFAMMKTMPEGKGKWLDSLKVDINSFFGFIDVTVEAPSDIHIPILPYRHKGSLYFPKGVFRGVHFSEELKYAIDNGYIIKEIHAGLEFSKKEDVFKEYVETFYKKKQEEAITKGGLYYIIKLLLNGLYGRFGMKYENKEYIVVDPDDVNKYYKYYTIHHEIYLKNATMLKISNEPSFIATKIPNFFQLKEKEAPRITSFNKKDHSPVHVAAAIASYSRIVLDQCIRIIGEEYIAYVDTDGIIALKTLPDDYLDNTILGKWKTEGYFNEFYAFGPKAYRLDTLRGPEYIINRCKGIPKKQIEEAIKKLKETATYTSFEIKHFSKDLKSMKIRTNLETEKTITAYTTKKRKFVEDSTITYPLIAPKDFNNDD